MAAKSRIQSVETLGALHPSRIYLGIVFWSALCKVSDGLTVCSTPCSLAQGSGNHAVTLVANEPSFRRICTALEGWF